MNPAAMLPDTAATPWYRQFWPWFLIALPGTVVVASVATLLLALSNDDSRVVDDYYKEGLAINQRLATDQIASQLALQAQLAIAADGRVELTLTGELAPPAQLQLQLIHPVDNRRDQTVLLARVDASSGHYAGLLDNVPAGRWHLQLGDPADPRWRLRDSAVLGAGATLTLSADNTAEKYR